MTIHKLAFEVSNVMANVKFFLDTGALIALSGLKGSDLQIFKTRIEAYNPEIGVTHVQVDETINEKYERKLRNYQQVIDKALESLTKKGIAVHVEPTKIGAWSISRWDYFKWGGEETGKLYEELRNEIDRCEEAKGKTKTLLNIACDAVIAVSSLDHDFFVTCDECLFDSWRNVIDKNRMFRQQFKIPKVIYARPYPKEVAKAILRILS